MQCDALLLDEKSRTDTYPYNDGAVGKYDSPSKLEKISEEAMFYLMSRGMNESDALSMIVMGFLEPFTGELPMEYAVELNK